MLCMSVTCHTAPTLATNTSLLDNQELHMQWLHWSFGSMYSNRNIHVYICTKWTNRRKKRKQVANSTIDYRLIYLYDHNTVLIMSPSSLHDIEPIIIFSDVCIAHRARHQTFHITVFASLVTTFSTGRIRSPSVVMKFSERLSHTWLSFMLHHMYETFVIKITCWQVSTDQGCSWLVCTEWRYGRKDLTSKEWRRFLEDA